jgi:alpha-ketoglutarate-dependent taurine dioxygenase
MDRSTLIHSHGQFDNHAAKNIHIEVKPLAAAMGAEICGVDCATVTDAQFAEIERALFRHKMIYFRQQKISHADQSVFSRRFGPFAEDAYTKGVPDYPEVQPVIKEANERTGFLFGSGWHTDSPFLKKPPAISTLRSIEIPPFGGDTMWANSALAYRTLSDTMKKLISDLRVHMSMRKALAGAQEFATPNDSAIGRLAATKGAETLSDDLLVKVAGNYHPLVRTHPRTGEKALYCDVTYTCGIEAMQPAEAASILDFLVEHLTQPAFTCRLRWEPDMFVMWDNRLCVHQAFNDYDGYRREHYRTTIAGEVPQ